MKDKRHETSCKHDYDLVVTDGRSGLVKCRRCGDRKKIGDKV